MSSLIRVFTVLSALSVLILKFYGIQHFENYALYAVGETF